jgi:hypothetical protein
MARHLAVCQKRLALIGAAEGTKRKPETLYYLRAQDAYDVRYWLDLEVGGSATLKALDSYLRAIWLECCGHLSQFSIGGWQGREIGKARRINEVFQAGVEVTHIYDFGTSSETLIKALGQRTGVALNKHAVVLMARNLAPQFPCIVCGQPGTHLCMECVIEEQAWGTLCAEHASAHEHDEYGEPVALANSPRMGMCGYTGPAEPPY